VKANGGVSRKVFKLKTLVLAGFASEGVRRSQVIKDFTTRKHFVGRHGVAVMVNGEVLASTAFNVNIQ
jgi:hypothetical protein